MRKPTVLITAAVVTLTLVLTGCKSSSQPSSQQQGQQQTEQAFQQQAAAVPYPADQLRDSLERRNIRAKLLQENKPDAIGYVYLQSFGKALGYFVIKGKVSSNNSQMTTSTLVERHGDAGGGNLAYDAPGDDGSYGPNEPGIFFFTTEGTMIKTNLDYAYSTQPIPFNVPKLNQG